MSRISYLLPFLDVRNPIHMMGKPHFWGDIEEKVYFGPPQKDDDSSDEETAETLGLDPHEDIIPDTNSGLSLGGASATNPPPGSTSPRSSRKNKRSGSPRKRARSISPKRRRSTSPMPTPKAPRYHHHPQGKNLGVPLVENPNKLCW